MFFLVFYPCNQIILTVELYSILVNKIKVDIFSDIFYIFHNLIRIF